MIYSLQAAVLHKIILRDVGSSPEYGRERRTSLDRVTPPGSDADRCQGGARNLAKGPDRVLLR